MIRRIKAKRKAAHARKTKEREQQFERDLWVKERRALNRLEVDRRLRGQRQDPRVVRRAGRP